MGKNSRRRRHNPPEAVSNATAFLDLAHSTLGMLRRIEDEWLSTLLDSCLQTWQRTPVLLRADHDFLRGLMSTDRDFEIPKDAFDRCRYPMLATVLANPFRVVRQDGPLTYYGFFAIGSTMPYGLTPCAPDRIRGRDAVAYSTDGTAANLHRRIMPVDRGPIRGADGVEFLWLARDDYSSPVAQQLTCRYRGRAMGRATTIDSYIQAMEGWSESNIGPANDQIGILAPIGLLTLLYLTSKNPDAVPVPRGRTQHQRRLERAEVVDLGMRVGSALRSQEAAAPTGGHHAGGWSLPPHWRSAHYQRYRVGSRDDWHYETRWKAPCPVNVEPDGLVAPVVRDLA